MQGLMMDTPLQISQLIRHADRHHGAVEIVSKTVDGGAIHRYTYREAHARARKLANALKRLGVQQTDRVATLAWNSFRHFEIYYAVAGSGAVIHTITRACSPTRSPTSRTTPRTRSSSTTSLSRRWWRSSRRC